MPETKLKVELLRHTYKPEELVSMGAKLCYTNMDLNSLQDKISTKDQSSFIKKLNALGHNSVQEHASFTFAISGISRVCLAQLTRHRLASFSVQSQRYVSFGDGFNFIIPPKIAALGDEAKQEYIDQMNTMHKWYKQWQDKLEKGEQGNEDARFVLPGACETRLILTMNARELKHFFSLRMCNRAQWEIRDLAAQMFLICLNIAPVLFENAGAGCIRGACPEGSMSCGLANEIREERKQLLLKLSI